jgi:Calcineurin-like phosphoesterase
MQTPIFTWLHVSDIHFGHGDATHGWNQKLVLSKLLEDLQQRSELDIPVPDAIFVTGDIAFSGAVRARDEYDRARDWLNSIADALHLTSRDVFLVPGNHDVQRDVFKNDRDVWRLVDRLRSGDESIDEALAHPEDCERLSRRLTHYLDFAAQFGPGVHEQQRLFWVQRIPLQHSLTLRVAGLNTALLCQDDQDQGRLALGTAQLASALELTPLTERELIVVLTHHPFAWLRDSSDVTKWIKRDGLIHLSGHVHDADSEDSRSGSGKTFVRVVAGAAHNERLPQGVPAGHGYSISAITFDSEGHLSLCVWPRRWSDKNKDFRADVDNLPDGETHAIHPMNMRIELPVPALAPTQTESIQIDDASRPARSESLPSTAYVMELTRTSLWRRLADCCQDVEHQEFTVQLLDSVQQLSDAAYQRLANYAVGEYSDSLSDPKHPLRMIELLGRIVNDEVLCRLNAVELSILILSAHYHDQGLLLTPSEIEALQQAPDFHIFRDNWAIEHPTLREIRERIRNLQQDDPQKMEFRRKEQQLHTGLLFDYLCTPTTWNHAEQSAAYVIAQAHSDYRWTIAGHDLAAPVADICAAHLLAAHALTMRPGFYFDRSIGPFPANMPFLAAILQIADLMDFDRERTPDSLYRSMHYTNSVSLDEWESHRHSGAWQYSGGVLRYSLPCKHPVYQRAALEFMELIERQLSATRELISSFPGTFGSYDFQFPLQIDRSRIQPETGAYVYHDLEFSLSRDEIGRLLMTDKLYSSASLCVRELLQNSLDALRYRRALFRRDASTDWNDGKVSFTHTLAEHGT